MFIFSFYFIKKIFYLNRYSNVVRRSYISKIKVRVWLLNLWIFVLILL